MMKSVSSALVVLGLLCSCTAPDGPRPIRTQADVDRYNATVSSEGEKLVCSRERVVGSNLPQFICMTNNQRERLAQEARETVDTIQRQ